MSYGMRGGRLREVITIQSYTEARDGYGQAQKTFSSVESVRAAVKMLSSAENIAGGRYNDRAVYEFVIRYTANIDNRSRILWRNQYYEIIGEPMDMGERNRQLKITAARYG